MTWNRLSRKAGERVRVGRRTISVPSVPSMTDRDEPTPDGPTQPGGPAGDSDQQPPVDRNAVQYLDRVRAIFRPTSSDKSAPSLERFIGKEDIFRHVGEAGVASHRGTANDAMPVALVQRRDLGADPRSGNTRDPGRSGRSSGLMGKKRLPGAGER